MPFVFTKPRGTLVRTWPDWRLDELCIGNFASLATGALLFQYIALFNNDNSGRSIVIWSTMFSVDQFDFCHFYLFQGHRGTAVANCANVSPQRAPAFGQMYFDTPGAKYSDVPIVSAGTLIGQTWPQNTPALVVPAGWSVSMGSDLAGSDTSLTIWYLPTAGI
jgi:hypothetical protein